MEICQAHISYGVLQTACGNLITKNHNEEKMISQMFGAQNWKVDQNDM